MVTINLLPWREIKFKQKRRRFFAQTLGLLSLLISLSGLLWAKNCRLIESQVENLNILKADNGEVFSQLENFQSAQKIHLQQQKKAKRINQLVSQRQIIPQLLTMLENKKLSFQVSYLLVNHENIKLIGTDNSMESALTLLNTLREESGFCQVIFTPFETKQAVSIIEFELQARICNELVDQ